ncbi:hypothetical protein NPIL_525981 [Nephila pilipes]|uniref:Uncharacterized protein n=1 Tax=Nephila pilipes TaxID=299642 RepID=A0A8X6U8M0_NEPPI|nr:hypothetical protein NPIL_525981 [Nephila pilipes]
MCTTLVARTTSNWSSISLQHLHVTRSNALRIRIFKVCNIGLLYPILYKSHRKKSMMECQIILTAIESDHLVQSTYPETFHPEIDEHLATGEVMFHPAGI